MLHRLLRLLLVPTLFFGLLSVAHATEGCNAVGWDEPHGMTGCNLYYPAVSWLYKEGIATGDATTGKFNPERLINRAEFTKIVLLASGTQPVTCAKDPFPDVPKNAWFAPYICAAKEKGIIGGFPDETFKPGQNVNFSNGAKILAKTFVIPIDPKDAQFDDSQNIWYRPYTMALLNKKAVAESINAFTKELTRGEMAEMLMRLRTGETSINKGVPEFNSDGSHNEASQFNNIGMGFEPHIPKFGIGISFEEPDTPFIFQPSTRLLWGPAGASDYVRGYAFSHVLQHERCGESGLFEHCTPTFTDWSVGLYTSPLMPNDLSSVFYGPEGRTTRYFSGKPGTCERQGIEGDHTEVCIVPWNKEKTLIVMYDYIAFAYTGVEDITPTKTMDAMYARIRKSMTFEE